MYVLQAEISHFFIFSSYERSECFIAEWNEAASSEKADYEARLSAYEAFCGNAAKYEAPLVRYEAKSGRGLTDLLQRRNWGDFMRISAFSGSKLSFLIFSSYGAKAECFIAE